MYGVGFLIITALVPIKLHLFSAIIIVENAFLIYNRLNINLRKSYI